MKLTVHNYSLPFRTPFRTAGHLFDRREGFVFLLWYDDGSVLASEAAPLPGFSPESAADATDYLSQNPGLWAFLNQTELPDFPGGMPPSLQFACSMIWLKHHAKKNGCPVTDGIPGCAEAAESVPVNAAIGLGHTEAIISKTAEAVALGYDTVKYKIVGGGAGLLQALQHIRSSYPALGLRLDANGCWSPDEAAGILRQFEPLQIEYCEQPVSPENDHHLQKLRSLTRIPIAADESARTVADAERIINEGLADVLILKPMICGSARRLLEIVALARKAGTGIIFTTSLDSAIARRDAALLASALAGSGRAHGLSTGSLLSSDTLTDADPLANGRFLTGKLPATFNPDLLNFSVLKKLYERTV